MLPLDVISFICTSYIALSRQFWRDISQIIVILIKKNIYIKFINRFKFDYHNTTIILLPYQNNLPTITIIKCEWLRVSLESIKTVGVKNREDRENKGMSRRRIRPEQLPPHPFRGEQLASNAGWNLVHRIPAHVDRLVELQPRLNLTRWQKILSHNCTRPSDGIDRVNDSPSADVGDPPSRASIILRAIPSRWTTDEKFYSPPFPFL